MAGGMHSKVACMKLGHVWQGVVCMTGGSVHGKGACMARGMHGRG